MAMDCSSQEFLGGLSPPQGRVVSIGRADPSLRHAWIQRRLVPLNSSQTVGDSIVSFPMSSDFYKHS